MDLIASSSDALVNPSMWEDPFENFFLTRTEVRDAVSNSTIPLRNLAEDWFGQCWSTNKETDAMWRIYSPNPKRSIGVKVRTTVRKLLLNLMHVGSSAPYLQFFIGRVSYMSEAKLTSLMATTTFSNIAIGSGRHFAELLCIKRQAFRHEAEVRLLYQQMNHPNSPPKVQRVFKVHLDPHAVFDEVVLDPRLTEKHAVTLKRELQAAGCRLAITQSLLYRAPRFCNRTLDVG